MPRDEHAGSLSHAVAWCCLWCNAWPNQRWIGASDHGAIPADSPDEGSSTHEPAAMPPWVTILSCTSRRTISAVTRGRAR
jgi:hypothetical protein